MMGVILYLAVFLYSLGVIVTWLLGAFQAYGSAEYGKNDVDFISGKILMKYAFIFPIGITKAINARTEDEEDE